MRRDIGIHTFFSREKSIKKELWRKTPFCSWLRPADGPSAAGGTKSKTKFCAKSSFGYFSFKKSNKKKKP
jgi:hypothetical protein